MEKIKSKEEILLNNLTKYFYNNKLFENIIPIITGNSNISLRTIDWFVTNYSYRHNIIYTIKNNSDLKNFNVYICYKNQLKAYNKRFFDPFCRINKNNIIKTIIFKYNENNYIKTTIGQINFFKWVLENDILNYIIDNYNNIYNDMKIKKIKKKNNIDIQNICNPITTTINFSNINKLRKSKDLKPTKIICNNKIFSENNFNFKLIL